jgi:hypothetical protein
LLGKLGIRGSETEKSVDIGSLLQSRGWGRTKAEVERETKGSTNSRDAANNIDPIYRAAVPNISGSVGSLGKDSVGATVISGDGDSFITKEAMKVFHTNGLVIATSSNMDADIQDGADRLKQAFEGTAIIDNDETAETNFQKNFLDQQSGEVMGGDVAGGINEEEPSEVAHRVHEVGFATIVGNFARGPKIDMENIKGTVEGPGKDKLPLEAMQWGHCSTQQAAMSLRQSGQKKRRRMRCKVL